MIDIIRYNSDAMGLARAKLTIKDIKTDKPLQTIKGLKFEEAKYFLWLVLMGRDYKVEIIPDISSFVSEDSSTNG